MNTKKQKNSSIAITFYVIAVLMLIVMAFEIYLTQTSLASQMESYGITFADEWQTIIFGYYFSAQNLLPLTAALLCYGIGHIINKIQFTQDALLACLSDAEVETKEADGNEELNLEELEAERKKTNAANEAKKKEEVKESKETVAATDTKEEVITEEAKKEEPKKKKTTAKKKTTKKEDDQKDEKEPKVETEAKEDDQETKPEETVTKETEVKEKEETKA